MSVSPPSRNTTNHPAAKRAPATLLHELGKEGAPNPPLHHPALPTRNTR